MRGSNTLRLLLSVGTSIDLPCLDFPINVKAKFHSPVSLHVSSEGYKKKNAISISLSERGNMANCFNRKRARGDGTHLHTSKRRNTRVVTVDSLLSEALMAVQRARRIG